MIFFVYLNGTEQNPFRRYGYKRNPFPQQISYDIDMNHLAELGGDPIPNEQYIKDHLKGWKPEFVNLCVSKFQKGKYIIFHADY